MPVYSGQIAKASDSPPGSWSNWTPTYGGFTAGNSTVVARYMQIEKLVTVRYAITFGSTATFPGTTFTITPPVTVAADYALNHHIGSGYGLDSSVGSGSRKTFGAHWSGSAVFFTSANLDTASTVTQLVPWTWAVGDVLSFQGTYEAA